MESTGLNIRDRFRAGLEELGHRWGWYLALGIALIVLGLIAVSDAYLATVASVIVFGWILIAGGVLLGFISFLTGKWSGFLLALAAGILSFITGIMMLRAPLAGAATLTLLILSFFIIEGIYRTIASIALRFPNWGWSLASGIVSIVLGGILLAGWPQISFWFVGLLVGIDLIVHGFSWCMFAMSVHNVSRVLKGERRERPAA
jgi:uncharacterized membrane protein HdeD (DUF308 family)